MSNNQSIPVDSSSAPNSINYHNKDYFQEILDKSNDYFQAANLRPFLLSLPLSGKAAEINQEGIRAKIFKNRSQIAVDYNNKSTENNLSSKSIDDVNQVVNKLTSNDMVGFVMIIAESLDIDDSCGEKIQERSCVGKHSEIYNKSLSVKNMNNDGVKILPPVNKIDEISNTNTIKSVEKKSKSTDLSKSNKIYHFRPIAGGIVELLDEYERAIRCIWCRHSLPVPIAGELLRVLVILIIAHAFNWQHPSNPNKKTISKLVSSLESHALSFPTHTYDFLTSRCGLSMSKHWETEDDGGSHIDSPTQKCKCFKLADKQNSWQFWGISECRFLKIWNLRKQELIPLNPIDGLPKLFNQKLMNASKESGRPLKKSRISVSN